MFQQGLEGLGFSPFPWLNFKDRSQKIKGKDVPVAVDVEEEVRGAHGQRDLVPAAVGHAVRKYLCPGLPVMYVAIPNLIPQTTALQFKIAVCKATKIGFIIFLLDITGIISPHCLLAHLCVSQNLQLVKQDTETYKPKANCTTNPTHLLSAGPGSDVSSL